MREGNRLSAAVVAVAVGLAVLIVGAAPASAADDFYTPPSPLPAGRPGDIIRNEPGSFSADVDKTARVQRIMYLSRDMRDEPIAVTGTVLTPNAPWQGRDKRPIIAYAPGTHGLGDQCAPSRTLAGDEEYEGEFVLGLLGKGWGVVVTDYQGLGPPGLHTYANRKAEAHAVLDSIRAAQRLPAADLPQGGPVAIGGYSQGGGAAAAAAELQDAYAPELELKGVYAGAPPANLKALARFLDDSYAIGFGLFAIASFNYSYPDRDILGIFNEEGRKVLKQVETECVVDALANHTELKTKDLIKDGRPFGDYLDTEPYDSVFREQQIGLIKPAVPVLVAHSSQDDIVPYEQGKAMAQGWCNLGATVQFKELDPPSGHLPAMQKSFPVMLDWLTARLDDAKVTSNCGSF